ncbi:MAG TPA: ATP-dependent protease, partial [Marinobacter sp.]
RQRQLRRGVVNSALGGSELHDYCRVDPDGETMLSAAMERLGLSARALHRILRVARTLADLEGQERIGNGHLVEALGYRKLDRQQTRNAQVSV